MLGAGTVVMTEQWDDSSWCVVECEDDHPSWVPRPFTSYSWLVFRTISCCKRKEKVKKDEEEKTQKKKYPKTGAAVAV